jgi:hypothetical protein
MVQLSIFFFYNFLIQFYDLHRRRKNTDKAFQNNAFLYGDAVKSTFLLKILS